jgi:ribonuclease R
MPDLSRSRMLARVVAGELRACFDDHARPLAEAEGALPVGAFVEARRDAGDATTQLLAAADSPRAALYELLVERAIDPVFPDAVEHETAAIVADPQLASGTEDLRSWPFVTIDNDDSRDLDQALLIERQAYQEPGGGEAQGYVLHYALADASFYVRPGTALFDEALLRGATYYLPGFAAPMLPPALSEGMVSLNPEVERRALVFSIELDAAARPRRVALRRGRICSLAKLSYSGVQAFYDAPADSELHDRPFSASLELLREVGELRIAAAEERGVVDYDRRELELWFDEHGVLQTGLRLRLPVERYNEQISLLCNTEGAALLLAHADNPDAQPIYRIHPPPLAGRLDELEEEISGLVAHHGLDEQWRWGLDAAGKPLRRLGDYLRELPKEPARVRQAIASMVRHVNRASTFEPGPGPHHALRVEAYARFSAPMREVVGIFTHREAIELSGLRIHEENARGIDDEQLRARAIEVANASRKTQRWLGKKSEELAIDTLLRDDLQLPLAARPYRLATVIGISRSRLYVELDAFAVAVKLYAWDLEETFATRYVANGCRLMAEGNGAPTFAIGDGLSLRTRGYDDHRHRWVFIPEHL